MFLGTINRSWDKEKRSVAYLLFGEGYTTLAEYEKAASFLRKALAITNDPGSKVTILCTMGAMSRYACNYDDAVTALHQALEILSSEKIGERCTTPLLNFFYKSDYSWSKLTASVHHRIGYVLSDWGKRDAEALKSFERAICIMKEEYPGDDGYFASMHKEIGLVHARLGNWDESIDFLYLAHSKICATGSFHAELCEEIARVRLDQYFGDERLLNDTQERKNVLMEAARFRQDTIVPGSFSYNAILNCVQVAYLLAEEIDHANELLMLYFEGEMKKQHGICCRSCRRKAGNGTDIKICRGCHVVDYCSKAHQRLAWRRGRLSHKVMCPFLKRYRLVAKAKNRIDTESYEDICKDFFETVCVLNNEVE
jgi:tetratricopeptide (TPR) repeat protein